MDINQIFKFAALAVFCAGVLGCLSVMVQKDQLMITRAVAASGLAVAGALAMWGKVRD